MNLNTAVPLSDKTGIGLDIIWQSQIHLKYGNIVFEGELGAQVQLAM